MMPGISFIGYVVWLVQDNMKAKRTYAICFLFGTVILPWVGYLVMVIQLSGADYNFYGHGYTVGVWLTIWGVSFGF